MKGFKKATAILLMVVFCLTIFATMAPAASLSGTIAISGSTTVQPLAELLKTEFNKENPDVTITIAGGGSGVGVKDVSEGSVNIGNASRKLKDEEIEGGLVAYTLAYDAICIVVNPKNPVQGLTADQVTQIFTGEITNWSDLGGNDAPIFLNRRTEPSGTMDYFKEAFMGEEGVIAETAKQHESNGLLVKAVAGDENAIGFCSMGYLNETIKALPIDESVATVQNVLEGTYTYYRPLNMVTKGEATDLAKAFIDFGLSEVGQGIAATDWIAVNQKPATDPKKKAKK